MPICLPQLPAIIRDDVLQQMNFLEKPCVTLNLDHFADYSILLDYFPFTNLKTLCIRSKQKSVPSEELNRLMSHFEVSEYVKFCILNDKDFKLDNSIRFRLSDCLDIRNAVCLSPETFLNSSECSKIEIFGADFKPEVYEQFVSNWYHSTNQLLDYVSSWDKPRHEVSNFDKFQPMLWDPQRRSQYYNDYHGGFDIKRIDGKVATVGYRYFQASNSEDNEPPKPHMFEEYDRVSRVSNSEDNDEEEEIEDVIVVPEGVVDEYNTKQRYIEYHKRQRKEGRCSFMMIVW
ncbi:hypothetical protein B9Z55_003659 [Caenorhabditis nigoni]|uniref:F-box associated domain-containing protein n=1 Tax=Caenorhabditis nigoni TaxID=1611254 RepID=A0A2G5VS42_9PELO|nr:hypothetical protein B9Z55_003659 [Caenorhabditis nigoni]